MEILSPAGNFEGFIGAVNAGCDAVYLGASKYGARAYADNFSDEEIIKAIRLAHLHNVKVYLTVNTLIKEKEFSNVCECIRPFYEAGLDACIVQDIGLISAFSRLFPKMECHISTQGFSTSKESVAFYKSLGATRVVLARELSFDEIKDIKENVDIELETFIHGAMCYSYSGECLLSSCLGGRSGNRGRCAGPCRLPYKYTDGNGKKKEAFFLSMKDQCTIELIPKLIDANIDSLKIEGRMKRPEYTAFVTSIYRKYADLYLGNKESFKVSKKDIDNLKKIYLRSAIGEGYYKTYNGKEMISIESPAYSGNDDALMKEISDRYLKKLNPVPVIVYASVFEDCDISMTMIKDDVSVTVSGPVASKAINNPLTRSDIENRLKKLGDSPFEADELYVETDGNSFVSVKDLNELRRNAVNELTNALIDKYESLKTHPEVKAASRAVLSRKALSFDKKPIISVKSIEQFNEAKKYMAFSYILMDYRLLNDQVINLSNVLIDLPFVTRKKDINYLKELLARINSSNCLGVVMHNYEELKLLNQGFFDKIIISGPELYTFNKKALFAIKQYSDASVIPYELSKREIEELSSKDLYLTVYGKLPLMHTANCVVKTNEGCKKNKGDRFVYITDRTNTDFPVERDCTCCNNTIYNSIPTCLLSEKNINDYHALFLFTDENVKEVNNILSLYFDNKGDIPKKNTKAYFNRGVE